MAETNITKISSEYDMTKILQDVGKNYFGDDLSTQRIGMFGHITESMAHIFGASVLDASIRSSEYHTSTALRRETLLCEATELGLPISNATPETMTAYIGIITRVITNEANHDGYGTKVENDQKTDNPDWYFVIEKDSVINIADYDFMFEHDIQIKATWSVTYKDYVYSAKYLVEGDKDITSKNEYIYPKANTASELNNTYIQSYVINTSDESNSKILMLRVNLKQMSMSRQYHSVVKNDIISLTGVDFFYNDMLSHFNIYYKKNGSNTWEYIRPVSTYDLSDYDEKVIRYEIFHDDGKIRLNVDDFTPDYNSEIMIEIYTTFGSAANNLEYNGNGSDISTTLNTFEERHAYSGIEIACKPIKSQNTGADIPDMETLRRRNIITKSSLNGLDTEYDLYNYMKLKDIYNDYVFVKKESDTVERRYSAFTIPRMISGDIIPTSTLPLFIPLNKPNNLNNILDTIEYSDENSSITIKAGSPFLLKSYVKTKYETTTSGDVPTYYNNLVEAIDSTYIDTATDPYYNDDYYKANSLIPMATKEKDASDKSLYETTKDIIALEETTKVFASPYTIVYDIENQLTSFNLTSISDDVYLNMVDDEVETTVNFVVDHISINRDSSRGDNSYTITANVMPNGDYSKAIGENTYNLDNYKNTIMVKGFLYNENDEIISYLNFEQISYSDDIFRFSTNVIVSDMMVNKTSVETLDSSYRIAISDPYEYETGTDKKITIDGKEYIFIDEDTALNDKPSVRESTGSINIRDLKIGIAIYYLDREETVKIDGVEYKFEKTSDKLYAPVGTATSTGDLTSKYSCSFMSISDNTSSRSYPQFANICTYSTGTENPSTVDISVKYTLTNVYDNSANLTDLYKGMSDFIRSYSETRKIGEGDVATDYLIINDVPLIQYSKSKNLIYSDRVTDVITSSKDFLEEMSDRITNNFSLDYRFFRTYGPCRYFKLYTPTGNNPIDLGNLDIDISISILIRNGLAVSDNEVLSQIKTFVKERIERINDTESDYTIYMSNVITELETKFIEYIKSADMMSINGNGDSYRIIKYDLPDDVKTDTFTGLTKMNVKKYVPEYINVPLENINIVINRPKY